MSSSSLRIAVLTPSLVLLLALLSAVPASTQGGIATTILSGQYPPDARLWGMAGASAALTQQPDQPLANPAAAIVAEKTEAIIGYLDTRLVAASHIYHVAEPLAHPQAISLGPAPPYESVADEDLSSRFAARCGPDSQWAWGIAAEAGAEAYPRSLGLGLLYHPRSAFSLGLNCNQLIAPGATALHIAALGAAYQHRGLSVGVDLCTIAGCIVNKNQMLLGAEYRLPNALALRFGSANGSLSYGIGARRGNWSLDLAHICANGDRVFLPAFPLAADSDLTVISLRCNY